MNLGLELWGVKSNLLMTITAVYEWAKRAEFARVDV